MDVNDLNNLSEVESLSDSDWLDISSRASEDNDSFADSDVSDQEDYRPPSRRSLASLASSREGEIHGWEGIVEDSSDEAPSPPPEAGTSDPTLHVSQQSLSLRAVALSEAAIARHTALEDPEEEQRVKDALDQSMVSTLSTSRSNSLNASVQTSVVHSRDLRLSFPDPLTSTSPATHSLSPSYEDITADMTHSGRATQAADASSEDDMALTTVDPGSMTTPAVVEVDTNASTEIHSTAAIDFYIVLYGASSAIKHRVVHRVLEKLMAATQCGISSLPQIEVPQNIRMLLSGGRETHCIISIIDRTGFVLSGKESSLLAVSSRPSLAVVFLPSPIIAVPEHTLYLPILTQEEFEEDDDDAFAPIDRLLDAEHQWETMGVPKGKLVSSAFSFSKSSVIEEEELERASPAKVARALRPLLPWTEQLSGYHLASRHAFTLFAILSIVLGYLVNGSLPLSGARRASPTIDIIARPAPSPVVNASGPAPATTPSSMALIPSSLNELALAAISPYAVASTSSVATKAVPSPTAASVQDAAQTGAPSECSCGCGLITWPEKFKATTDLMLRPTPPTPSLVNPVYSKGVALSVVAPASAKDKGKARASEDGSLYALSTRLAGALTEYLDMRTMFAQTHKDIQEILDALDELSRSISRQTEVVWEQSKATVQVVRENIRARHERAKTRAKELREAGKRLLSSVSEQMRGRVAMARENAQALRENARVRREESFRVRQEWREARRERRVERRAVRQERRARRGQPLAA